VHPSKGLGVSIMALFLVGAVIYRLAAKRPEVDELAAGLIAILFTLAAVALQFFEYTTLDFGAASGGYAAVFFGWTATYAIVALMGIYWIETQTASLWRARREGARETEIPASEGALIRAGIEAASFYWAYFVAIGVLAWIVLYIV
jgi:heme/copper-type cytochrome/quinol oxidase subunit 3